MTFQERVSLAVLVMIATVACSSSKSEFENPVATLEIRLAFGEAADCPGGCQIFEVVDVFGRTERVHVPATAGISIPVDQIIGAGAWTDGESSQMIAFLLADAAASEVSAWAQENAPQIGDRAIVTLNGSAIGTIRGVVLRSTGGLMVLPVRNEDELERIRERVVVMEIEGTDTRPINRGSVCVQIAGSDTTLEKQCDALLTKDLAREGEALDRIEAELDSEDPDYDQVLRELGVQ